MVESLCDERLFGLVWLVWCKNLIFHLVPHFKECLPSVPTIRVFLANFGHGKFGKFFQQISKISQIFTSKQKFPKNFVQKIIGYYKLVL